ncbi:MAG: hypothetical protein IE933_04205 [Sphingomonadales bacterium]|nr:hypothetical protein [Sphingomonadales bacterium]MBD3772847.1 hypothetical protein [Paracoccaceae bacterium]
MKAYHIIAALAATAMIAGPAAALPSDADSSSKQLGICRDGTIMIIGGKSDDEELAFYKQKLKEYGWTSDADYYELLGLCNAYKQGFLDGVQVMKKAADK